MSSLIEPPKQSRELEDDYEMSDADPLSSHVAGAYDRTNEWEYSRRRHRAPVEQYQTFSPTTARVRTSVQGDDTKYMDETYMQRRHSTFAEEKSSATLLDPFCCERCCVSLPCSVDCRFRATEYLWVTLLATLAATLSFWLPSWSFRHINLTAFFSNVTGSFIVGVVSSFEVIKYQYKQAYLIYAGVKGGFSSVWTSFGNFIEDSGDLLYFRYGYLWSLSNLVITLICAFFANYLGRLLGDWWKRGASKYALEVDALSRDAALRMQFELDREVFQSTDLVLEERERDDDSLLPSSSQRSYSMSGGLPTNLRVSVEDYSSASDDDETHSHSVEKSPLHESTISAPLLENEPLVSKSVSRVVMNSAAYFRLGFGSAKNMGSLMDEIDRQQRLAVKRTGMTTMMFCRRQHLLVAIFSGLTILAILISVLAVNPTPNPYSNLNVAPEDVYRFHLFDFFVSVGWSVFGALAGGIIGGFGVRAKHSVQWGTFRVNMLSCILIGFAHNILLLRSFFPGGDNPHFVLVIQRFISDFCGSESSFAGLIDETMTLFLAPIPRKIVLRNMFYNLFVCLGVFFLVIFSVYLVFFENVYF